MSEVFADTGYWAALQDSPDRLHGRALALTREIEPRGIVTTQMVLVEVINMFGGRGEQQRRLAPEVVDRAERGLDVERADQTCSLTDCASFIVMEERGITEALAHAREFEQAGFTALLRRSQ